MKPTSSDIKTNDRQLNILKGDSIFIIIKNDGSFAFNERVTYSDLSKQELFLVDSLLSQAVLDYNTKQRKGVEKIKTSHPEIDENNYLINIKNYRFQIIPVIDLKGDKIVWINAFCERYNNIEWNKQLVLVKDGGSCFFNLKINLTKKEYFNFIVNGVA